MLRNRSVALPAGLLAVLTAVLYPAAYERDLSRADVREAYFLGRRTDRADRFLRDYVRQLPLPKQGPHVARIELSTPYHQVVKRSRYAIDGSGPIEAQAAYRENPLQVWVRVEIRLTPTYPAHSAYTVPAFGPIYVRPPDFWQDFSVHLLQKTEVAPRRVLGRPLYTHDPFFSQLKGAEIELEFDTDEVASSRTLIVVLTPDGQQVEAEFDLRKLR